MWKSRMTPPLGRKYIRINVWNTDAEEEKRSLSATCFLLSAHACVGQGKPSLTDLIRFSAVVLRIQPTFLPLTERQRTFVRSNRKENNIKKTLFGFFKVSISLPSSSCLDKFSASCSHEQKVFLLKWIGICIKNPSAIVDIHEDNTDFYHCPPCYFASQSKKFLLHYRTGVDLVA